MVQRLLSTLFLAAFVCNAFVASSGGQILCSHFDGRGHVVEMAVHERETSQLDCHESHEEAAKSLHSHDDDSASHSPHCEDEEYLNPDLGSQLSGKDRLVLKSIVMGEAACGFDLNAFALKARLGPTVSIETPHSEDSGLQFARLIRLLR